MFNICLVSDSSQWDGPYWSAAADSALITHTSGTVSVWFSNENIPSWSLFACTYWGQNTGFYLKFHLQSCGKQTLEQSPCLCAAGWGRCKAASAWCLSRLLCPGRYWCSYCFPETHGRSSVLGSGSRGKSFTTDLEKEACRSCLCHVLGFQSLFHLPGMEDKQLSCSSFSLVVEANVLPLVVPNLTTCNEDTCSRRLKSKLQLLQWSLIIS